MGLTTSKGRNQYRPVAITLTRRTINLTTYLRFFDFDFHVDDLLYYLQKLISILLLSIAKLVHPLKAIKNIKRDEQTKHNIRMNFVHSLATYECDT